MVNNDLRQKVAGIMGAAQPEPVARVLVKGSGNVVVGGDVHLYSPMPCQGADVMGLVAALGVLNGEQLSRVSKFVAAVRGGH